MLTERKIKEPANQEEYIKVFNYFHDEYTGMMKDFLMRHEVKINEDDNLINYIIKARCFTPRYAGYTIPITNAMYSDTLSENMKYQLLMNSYPIVKDVFSK
ncbi:MAG: hypothetical protein IJ629_04675 [Clostridia bacterium]|nr:hypothetical protein [Clostridia bacterium]